MRSGTGQSGMVSAFAGLGNALLSGVTLSCQVLGWSEGPSEGLGIEG